MTIPPWLDRLRRNRFWRSVITLLSGSVLAQGLGLALLPILGTLYSVDSFGLQGTFMAVVQTVVIAANGGYEQAIMLPEHDADARALLRLSQLINLITAVVVGLALWAVGTFLWEWLEAEVLGPWLPLLLLSIWLEGNMQALRMMLNRQGNYRILSISKVGQAIVSGGLMVFLGWAWGTFAGLLVGWVAGSATAWVIMGSAYLLASRKQPYEVSSLSQVAWAYRDFPTLAVWSGWLNTFSRQLPFYLLPAFFGQTVTGYYQMAHRALMLPMSLISRSVAEVFYRQATHTHREGAASLATLTRKMAKQMALLGTGPLLLVMALGPWAASFILGPEWETSGVFARWLMPWVFLMFITSPLTSLLDVHRRLSFQLLYNLALFFVRLGALLIGGYFLSPTQSIMLYAGLGSIMVAFHLGYLLRLNEP